MDTAQSEIFPPFSESLPWTSYPLVVSAPMRLISTASLAVTVSRAGGLGFIGAGTDLSTLDSHLFDACNLLAENDDRYGNPFAPHHTGNLPVGVGVITHAASLKDLFSAITPSPSNNQRPPPVAIWLFAPHEPSDLAEWARAIRNAEYGPRCIAPQIWVQAGSVSEAIASTVATQPEVLVIQGADAGGHGVQQHASIVTQVPEICDSLGALQRSGELLLSPHVVAAGGIMDGRGAAAALALGANGVCLGTRFLATPEAVLADGYKAHVLEAKDGGLCTVRTRVYDELRGTTGWPERFGGRGVTNASWDHWQEHGHKGMDENKKQYEEALKAGDSGWGRSGRMTTYAGTGVGIVKHQISAKLVVDEVRSDCRKICDKLSDVVRQ